MPYPPDADVSAQTGVSTYIDTTVPSTARVYDAALGGKENYEVDRELVKKIERLVPQVTQVCVLNRDFLVRACRFLARETGIDQFLDCGSGLPTAENVHQIVHRHNPHARVVYTDNDPIVAAHARALLEDNNLTRFAVTDVFTPDNVLTNETVSEHLNWSEPMVFLQVATLHFCDSDRDPAAIMRRYIDALPAGSYVVFSHVFNPGEEYQDVIAPVEQHYATSGGNAHFRTYDELIAMLDGLELVEPGLVPVTEWWPVGPPQTTPNPIERCIAGAVGYKPH